MSEPWPPRSLLPGGRFGWFASSSGKAARADDDWVEPDEGSLIRFMADDGADVPLWSDAGHLFATGEELVRRWGVSDELAAAIVTWGRASQHRQSPGLDAEAARCVRE